MGKWRNSFWCLPCSQGWIHFWCEVSGAGSPREQVVCVGPALDPVWCPPSPSACAEEHPQSCPICLEPEFVWIFLLFCSLYFWNFSSGTYWLKNKHNNSPPSPPFMKTATQQLRILIFFKKAFLTAARETFKLHFVSWSHWKRRQRKWSISDSGSQRCFVSLLIECETSCRWWVEPW